MLGNFLKAAGAAGWCGLLAAQAAAAPFSPNSVVVYRVGNGQSGLSNTGSAVYLDEYSTSGNLLQSLPMPTAAAAGHAPLIASGTASSEGLLSRSTDGRYLILTGYGRPLGGSGSLASSLASVVPRVVGRVDGLGLIDTRTALSDFADGNNPRSAVSTDGEQLWLAGGAGGPRHTVLGLTTSTQLSSVVSNLRHLLIADQQLYFSTSSGSNRLGQVGTGLPTTAGQLMPLLPGMPTDTSPYAWVLLDLDAGVAGVDTAYVADDGGSASTGIAKFSRVGGTWVSNGQIGTDAEDYRGLTAKVDAGIVTLYAVRRGGTAATGGGELVRVVDASGYNATLSGTPAVLATAASNTAFRGVALSPAQPLGAVMRITEFMYSGPDGEFIEFTNVGDQPADLTGWSFDDNSNVPDTQPLSAYGTVQPGESVILTEADAQTFRTAWGLCSGIKVIGGLSANLGGADRINLFDANDQLIDALDYSNSQQPGIVVSGSAAWVSLAAMGQNQITGWVRATVGDVEASMASNGGAVGSPGRSQRALVSFDPCATAPGTPEVTVDIAATTPLLDLPVNGGGALSAVLGDPTDPIRTLGVVLRFNDPDGLVGDLVLGTSSSVPTVLDPAQINLSGSGDTRTLTLNPQAVGYTTVDITATDSGGKVGRYSLQVAVSGAAVNPATHRFHTGASDASTAIALDAQYMWVGDDESQRLRLYRRDVSGLPAAISDHTAQLGLTDLDGGVPREVDIEASVRAGSRIFWAGSHGNQATGSHNPRPNRRRVYATDLSGRGVLSTLTYAGRYDFLAEDLVVWDQSNGHGLGANALGLAASSAPNVSPETAAGFNLEGLALLSDGTALLGFRAPRLDTTQRDRALLIPVLAFDPLVTGNGTTGSLPAGSATFGAPMVLDLGGRAIRSIDCNAMNDCVLLAGPSGGATGVPPADFRLYQWAAGSSEAQLLDLDLTALALGGSPEGLLGVPESFAGTAELQVLVDNGDTVYYADGVVAKDLAERRHAKFRSVRIEVTLTARPEGILADGFE